MRDCQSLTLPCSSADLYRDLFPFLLPDLRKHLRIEFSRTLISCLASVVIVDVASCPYVRIGCIVDLYRCRSVFLLQDLKDALIWLNRWDAFLTVFWACSLNVNLLSIVSPRSVSDGVV